jgi:phospholipid-binding lipoprotein MlaA
LKNAIAVVATLAFIGLIQIESASGQALDNMEPAEIAKALPQSEIIRGKALLASESDSDGTPIATGVESESGRLIEEVNGSESVQKLGDKSEPAKVQEESSVSAERVGEWDPWRPFNEKTFWFNRQFDRFLMKPLAVVYNAVLPGPVRQGISNSLDNLDVARRFVHNVLQQDFAGAGREISRFVINSTAGVAGIFDVADMAFGIQESNRDAGQTLGFYGIPNGPYLVLPFLPPFTVRDFIGYVADEWLYPLGYFVPLGAIIGLNVADEIGERAANIDLYLGVEDKNPDLYGYVRSAYFQRRAFDPSIK